MKLVNFISGGKTRCGVATSRGVVDITALGLAESIDGVIAGRCALGRIAEAVRTKARLLDGGARVCARHGTAENRLRRSGQKARRGDGGEPPKDVFQNSTRPEAAGRPVVLPSGCGASTTRRSSSSSWKDGVERPMRRRSGTSSATPAATISPRDSQPLRQWLAGNPSPAHPAGPFVVTKDAFDPNADNRITCSVNGAVVQTTSLPA